MGLVPGQAWHRHHNGVGAGRVSYCSFTCHAWYVKKGSTWHRNFLALTWKYKFGMVYSAWYRTTARRKVANLLIYSIYIGDQEYFSGNGFCTMFLCIDSWNLFAHAMLKNKFGRYYSCINISTVFCFFQPFGTHHPIFFWPIRVDLTSTALQSCGSARYRGGCMQNTGPISWLVVVPVGWICWAVPSL